MQVQLFLQTFVGIIEELLSPLAISVTLHVLEATAARAQHPHNPSIPVRIVELSLCSEGLLQDQVGLLLRVTDFAVGAFRRAEIYPTH